MTFKHHTADLTSSPDRQPSSKIRTEAMPDTMPDTLNLAHTLGNQAMGRMLNAGVVQRKPDGDEPQPVDSGPLFSEVPPYMAGALGSTTIDGFITGKADVSDANKEKLRSAARYILGLLHQYPGSTVIVEGHTDAVGTDERNASLGQERADSTANVLISFGIKADMITKVSKGESDLKIKTGKAEPVNRRAEVIFKPYVPMVSMDFPKLSLTPPSTPGLGESLTPSPRIPYLPDTLPTTPDAFTLPGVTPDEPKIKDWLEEALKENGLVRQVPEKYRQKVVNVLKTGDEKLADTIIDSLPIDDQYKPAVKAAVKSVLQMIKGKSFKMKPEPSWRQSPFEPPDHSPWKPYKAPGEKIFKVNVLSW